MESQEPVTNGPAEDVVTKLGAGFFGNLQQRAPSCRRQEVPQADGEADLVAKTQSKSTTLKAWELLAALARALLGELAKSGSMQHRTTEEPTGLWHQHQCKIRKVAAKSEMPPAALSWQLRLTRWQLCLTNTQVLQRKRALRRSSHASADHHDSARTGPKAKSVTAL